MIKVLNYIFAITLMTLAGCIGPGLIYTDITRPFCKDLRGTTLGKKTASASSKRIDLPTPRIDITAEWDSKAIGDIAKLNGINTVNSCDERTQSILFGIFKREEMIIYGD